jgi:hypothetical protein
VFCDGNDAQSQGKSASKTDLPTRITHTVLSLIVCQAKSSSGTQYQRRLNGPYKYLLQAQPHIHRYQRAPPHTFYGNKYLQGIHIRIYSNCHTYIKYELSRTGLTSITVAKILGVELTVQKFKLGKRKVERRWDSGPFPFHPLAKHQ